MDLTARTTTSFTGGRPCREIQLQGLLALAGREVSNLWGWPEQSPGRKCGQVEEKAQGQRKEKDADGRGAGC